MKRKYRNKPVYVVDGLRFATKEAATTFAKQTGAKVIYFASTAEANRDADLCALERTGNIRNLKRQPRFPLVVCGVKICTYVGDWSYEEPSWKTRDRKLLWKPIVDDRKGVQTPAFKIKWALAKALHPEIEWRLS